MNLRAVGALFVASILFLFMMGGCNGNSPETEKNKEIKIGILLYDENDLYISLVSDALKKDLTGKAEFIIYGADRDQVVQAEQLDALIDQKVDALIVNLVEGQTSSIFVDKAMKEGLPIVFFNREPDLNTIKIYDKARFVGTIANDAGIMQGDIVAELWKNNPEYDRNADGKFQYVIFQGNLDNPEALARTEYSVKQAKTQGVDMQQIDQTYVCSWDEAQARQVMHLALAKYRDDIELVLSNNDAMALGAIAALNEYGFNLEGGDKFIPVVGVDATPQAVEAIKKGIMSATVKQDADGMAAAIVALTLNAVAGKDFLDGTSYKWDESGVAIRIPYSPYAGE